MGKSVLFHTGRIAVLMEKSNSRNDDEHAQHSKDCLRCEILEATFDLAEAMMREVTEVAKKKHE